MGGNNSKTKLQHLINDYHLIQEIPTHNIRFLEHNQTKQQFILRQFTFNHKAELDKTLRQLSELKNKLSGNKHVTALKDYTSTSEDQYCSTFYQIYALFQYPQRTLDDEINERALQKRKFTENQLWSILASCILGMSHLQRNNITHCCLKSDSILLSPEGVVKVCDPFATAQQSNYEKAFLNRKTPHLYLPPEQAVALQEELISPKFPEEKGDIWTMGMIMLEAGLLNYKDECYRDDWSRIHWESIHYNINCFGQIYSEELKNMVELMLSREYRSRPDWIQLEECVTKNQDPEKSKIQKKQSVPDHPSSINVSVKTITSPPQSPRLELNSAQKPMSAHQEPIILKVPHVNPSNNVMVQSSNREMGSTLTFGGNDFLSQRMTTIPPEKHVTHMQPIKHSLIEGTRPLKNIFPCSFYTTKTKSDENLIMVEEENKLQLEKTIPQQNPNVEYIVETFKLGSKYEGYKLNGKRHGHGKFYYQDGGMYEGEWKQNKMEGFGRLFYQSGKLAYDGTWHNDQFHGKGTLFNEGFEELDGSFDYTNFDDIQQYWTKYEGEFEEDSKKGVGVLFLSNGERYEGEFENDSVHGKGKFIKRNGDRISGRWNNNTLQN